MEFKLQDDVVIVDEKVTTVFEAKQVDVKPQLSPEEITKRLMEAYSDCA